MESKFSIITPSYNQGRFIERTIQSVLNQKVPNLEYVVFDGGSQDQTVSVLKKYENQFKWVSEQDRGQTHAVNKGIRATTGDVIGWLNSDDIYYPNAISSVMKFFNENSQIDIVYGNGNHIDENDKIIESYYSEPWNFNRLKEVCFICQPTVFFRRSVVERFGYLDESLLYCMDYEYWIRLALRGANFAYMQDVLAGSRFYQETKTLGSKNKVHYEINNMMKKYLKSVPDKWLFNYAHAFLEVKDIPRESKRFPFLVGGVSLLSALWWNKKISKEMLSTVISWVRKKG